jgi:hypothetical protein
LDVSDEGGRGSSTGGVHYAKDVEEKGGIDTPEPILKRKSSLVLVKGLTLEALVADFLHFHLENLDERIRLRFPCGCPSDKGHPDLFLGRGVLLDGYR